jgi:hypothetical protein
MGADSYDLTRLTHHRYLQILPVWRRDDRRFPDPSRYRDAWTRSSAVPRDLTKVWRKNENPLGSLGAVCQSRILGVDGPNLRSLSTRICDTNHFGG